jgi:hypothetical protein
VSVIVSFITSPYCKSNIPTPAADVTLFLKKIADYKAVIGNTRPYGKSEIRVTRPLVYPSNLTFMGPCILSIFYYISNKMQRYTVYLYMETALHVSGGTSTHHQERIQLYLQHLVFVTPLLLPAAIVEELER